MRRSGCAVRGAMRASGTSVPIGSDVRYFRTLGSADPALQGQRQTHRGSGALARSAPPQSGLGRPGGRCEKGAHLQERRPCPTRRPAATPPPGPCRLCGSEIDRIDEAMHDLLMERGRIIDTLIAVKKTADSGLGVPPGPRSLDDAGACRAPWRPAAPRHGRGNLAGHHRHVHLSCRRPTQSMRIFPAATRRCATSRGSTSASRCRSSATQRRRGDRRSGRIPRRSRHLPARPGRIERGVVAHADRARTAPRSSPACPSSSVPDHPAGTPVFVISKPLTDAAVRDVVLYARAVRALAAGRGRDASADGRRGGGERCRRERPVRTHRRSRRR